MVRVTFAKDMCSTPSRNLMITVCALAFNNIQGIFRDTYQYNIFQMLVVNHISNIQLTIFIANQSWYSKFQEKSFTIFKIHFKISYFLFILIILNLVDSPSHLLLYFFQLHFSCNLVNEVKYIINDKDLNSKDFLDFRDFFKVGFMLVKGLSISFNSHLLLEIGT